jgi:LuxR family maltose regulon positive regulatory protein
LTKARAPIRRPGLVRRNHLIERLSDTEDRLVTLVDAPAGYGKSTVLMQWAAADPIRRFGWVTLEKTDNDPVELWRYILLGLRTLAPGWSDRAWRLLWRPQVDLQSVISETVNELLDVAGRLVVVLDDYHLITNPDCHDAIQYFIDHLPHTTQVAFGTRNRPPLTLTGLDARGLVLELDRADLQFTLDETRHAIELAHGGLLPGQAVRIHEVTEGWPVGVYLSVKSSAPAASVGTSGAKVEVRRYLEEQVLDQLASDHRDVLARWSILGRLTGELCDRVTGRRDGAQLLRQLAETNQLVVPLDPEQRWYRLHDLLRDALRGEFEQQPPDERSTAHRCAADWWLEQGESAEAIRHAIDAADYGRAGELIGARWFEYLVTGRLETLRHWFGRFPDDALFAYPPLVVGGAWIAAFSGDVDGTNRFPAAAQRASYDRPMPDGSVSYESAVAILYAGLGQNGMTDANEHAEVGYALEPPDSPWRALAAALAGLTRFGLGRFDDARPALTEAAGVSMEAGGPAIYARGQLALLEMAEGNWIKAERHADLACAAIEELEVGDLLSSGAAQVAAAAVAAHHGQEGLARRRLHALSRVQASLSDAIPFDAFQIHLVAAEAYLAIGDHRSAAVHANTASARLEAFGDAGIFEPRMAAVRGALAKRGDGGDQQVEPLTDRELQVLELLPADLTLRDIGRELFVSRNTAKTHLSSVYRKLGVTSRSAAIAKAQELELI